MSRFWQIFFLLFFFANFSFGLEKTGVCAFAPIKPDPKMVNSFTPEQEVWLGEILSEWNHDSGWIVEDEALNAYLDKIGKRLVKELPPTNLDFRFYVYDSPVSNAYSIAGGRVYATRKLIGFTRNEDELAAVLAHELGHIVTHQQATVFSRIFQEEIGATKFGDRKDMEAKFNQMLESKKKTTIRRDDEQGEADRVGMDILVRAGYRAEAMTEFWDRFTANKGKTGSWFSDLFGSTDVSSKRYREMLKEAVKLPTECIEKRDPKDEQEFKTWQAQVVSYDKQGRPENVPGLVAKKALDPPLQDELHTLRFTPDGKYLLAQDNATIYVMTREPFAVKFMIPAEEAFPAKFTGDSRYLSFYTPELRAEVWELATANRIAAYDLHSTYGCEQTALTTDAKTLACIDAKQDLVIIDSATQDRIFEKKRIRSGEVDFTNGIKFEIEYVNMAFSPNGKYLLVAGKYGTIAVDVANRKEIPLASGVKGVLKKAFTFLDDGRILGLAGGSNASVVTFPDGNLLQSVELGASIPSTVTKGDYILMRPIKDYEVGVLDLKSGQIVRANKRAAMDIWGDMAVSELGTGEVALFGVSTTPMARVKLPRGNLAGVRVSAVSDDFQWLAVAEEGRGAIWNVSTGQRLYNIKSFQGAYFGPDGAYVDFPKQEKLERSVARLSLGQPGISLANKLGSGRFTQRGPYVITWKQKRNKPEKPDDEEEEKTIDRFNRYRYEGTNLKWHDLLEFPAKHETMELRDTKTGNVLWSRTFDHEVPNLFTHADADVIALTWWVGQPGVKDEFEKIPGLRAKKGAAKDSDFLVEIVDLRTGAIVGGVVLDTNDGMFRLQQVLPTRSWVAIKDSFGRVLVYNVKTGACTGKMFGTPYEMAADSKELLIRNDSRRFSLYDAETMTKRAEYLFSAPVANVQLSAKGDRMFALTDTQMTYIVDTKSKEELAGAK
jgi:hypothetical protein